MLRLVMEMTGFQVIEAADGVEALQQVEAYTPDILVLDVMMPEMDGLTVCRKLRAQAKTADLPIILFSGKTQVEAIREGMAAGASHYLCKPATPSEVIAVIKQFLGVVN